MILVDTSVLIDFLGQRKLPTAAIFRGVMNHGLPYGITSMIYQEVLQGAKNDMEFARLKKYLGAQRFYHPRNVKATYEEAARIYFLCRRQGLTIRSPIDCLIARIALENNLFLFHNDNDYEVISRLMPLKFFAPSEWGMDK
jgi:predicted nucleic acid-binding protein